MMPAYGKELILDLHECDLATFTRDSIAEYFLKLCKLIDMEACDLHFWDDFGVPADECQTEPHLKGISAIQFILTSNITIHTLDLLESVYVNIFSCKDFDGNEAATFTRIWFRGRIVHEVKVDRL
jgi:S-adenosylmethionine/arginine decarboxylase-like enzyme